MGAPGPLFSFAQFVRERQTDVLADWQARVLAARDQVDSPRAEFARVLLDCMIASATATAPPATQSSVVADAHTALGATASHAVTDVFLLRRAIARLAELERGGLSLSESEWLWNAVEGASRLATELVSARILESERRHQATESRQRFLQEASQLLAETLDYESTLTTIARLAVPSISDWCIIDVLRRDGTLSRVATEQKDPARAELASELHRNPPKESAAFGAPEVVRSGRTQYLSRISDALLEERDQDPERLRILRRLRLNSAICAPLRTRERLVGTITLLTEGDRDLTTDDLRMTEDLARRAAVAIENASLFEDAQRALRQRERVLAVVTHDLRTPLSAVMAAASLLTSDALNADAERVRQRADAIQRAARHMARLVTDLTDLAQIDAGRLAIEKKRDDPAALIRQAVDTLEPVVASRGGTLRCLINGDLPPFAYDRDRIMQVISNLVGNASKVGARTITIGAIANTDEVEFWVADDGPGIPSEDLPHMFDRYFRGHNAGYKGSGLGLPIANGIVDAHGGRMWIESHVGVGSTFFFALPR